MYPGRLPRHRLLCLSILALTVAVPGRATAAEPAPSADAQKYQLEFKFQGGQRVSYEITHDSKISSLQGTKKEVAHNRTQTWRSYRVLETDESGVGSLEMQLDVVKMSAAFENEDGPQGSPIEFDSSDPSKSDNPKFQHVLDSVGRPQSLLKIAPTGKPLEARRLGVPDSGDPAAAEKPRADNFLMLLPAEPVAVGDTWKEPFEVAARNESSLSVRIRMQTVYRLVAVEDNIAKITYRTVVLTPVEQPTIAAQLIQREVEGTIQFDIARGLILSREAKLDRSVVGAFGPQSTMHAESRYKERLIPSAVGGRETTSAN